MPPIPAPIPSPTPTPTPTPKRVLQSEDTNMGIEVSVDRPTFSIMNADNTGVIPGASVETATAGDAGVKYSAILVASITAALAWISL